jgi:ribonuclease HI
LPADPGPGVVVYTDGAARGNPGPAGIGVVVESPDGRVLKEFGEGIGIATNNVAEYRAALKGFELARDLGATRVLLRADSRLLVEQLAGRYKVKNPTLIRLHGEVRQILRSFGRVAFEHIPRELNKAADRMANRGVDEWLASEGLGFEPSAPDPDLFG